MRLLQALSMATLSLAAIEACSSSPEQGDGGSDASQNDVVQSDVGQNDVAQKDGATGDAQTDAGDGGCPAAWTLAPSFGTGTGLDVPDGGGGVLIHAAGSGTQNYTCEATDAGGYVWTFVGPEATLQDCASNVIGHHFASDGGPGAPEWETLDDSYVIGKKVAAYTPDGGSASVPWLLLQETSSGGTGLVAQTLYVQRLFTDGGVAPTTTCDNTTVGTTTTEPYTADYYFYGN